MTIDISELRKVIADCYWPTSPVAINEILDRLEAAEKDIARKEKVIDALGSRLNAVAKERDELRAKIEAAENDAAHQKALAASALRVAEGWERKCGELRAEVIYWKEQKEPGAAGWRALARILQAKIDAMEKQVPICRAEDLRHAEILLPSLGLMPEDKLYALPGAQPAPSVPDGWETDLLIVEHAMRMNNWDWNSNTSDDLKRSAYKIISNLLAAPEAKS